MIARALKRSLGGMLAAVLVALLGSCSNTQVSRSTALLVSKDYSGAYRDARDVLDRDPENEEALAVAAWSSFHRESFAKSQHYFRRLLAVNSTSFDGLLGMTWANMKLGHLDAAEPYLAEAARALRFEWQRRSLMDAGGWLAFFRGDLDAAEVAFRAELALAIEAWDSDSDAFVGLGWVALRRGDLKAAETMFERGLVRNDRCHFCRDGLARVALEHSDLNESERQVRLGLSIVPGHRSMTSLLDTILERRRDPDARVRAFEQLVEKHPDSAVYLARLGDAYRGAGRSADARGAYIRALQIEPQFEPARFVLQALSGQSMLEDGRAHSGEQAAPRRRSWRDRLLDSRIHVIRASIRHVPIATAGGRAPGGSAGGLLHRASSALYNQGWAFIDAGRLEEAERTFRAAKAQAPAAVQWIIEDGLGWVAFYRRDYESAEATFKRVLQNNPDSFLSRKGLGFVALERKAYDDALRHLLTSLSQNPCQVALSFIIPASRFLEAKQFSHARQILELGEWSYPRSADIQLLMARALAGLNERRVAIEKATLAASLDPVGINLKFDEFPLTGKDVADAYRSIAWGLYFAGDAAGAHRRFDQYIRAGGDDPDGLRGRGFSLFRLGRYEDALADLQKVVQFEPDRLQPITEEIPIPGSGRRAQITYSALSTSAWAYYRLNRAARAEAEFRKVLKINPFWVDALTGLGYSLLAQNDREGAERSFREALRISPGHFDARQGLAQAEAETQGRIGRAPETPR